MEVSALSGENVNSLFNMIVSALPGNENKNFIQNLNNNQIGNAPNKDE